MCTVKRIRSLPSNFRRFTAEVGDGLGELYGLPARADYLGRSRRVFRETLAHPMVSAWGVMRGNAAHGVLISLQRECMSQITFLHVLAEHAGAGVETILLDEAVAAMRARGDDGITCETMPFCELSVDEKFSRLGFETSLRELMATQLSDARLFAERPRISKACGSGELAEIASLIAETYASHAERELHYEVRSQSCALELVNGAVAGAYGETRAGFVRTVHDGGELAGAILGCQVAPRVGFVLQVVVRPSHQGRGIGRRMVCELAETFRIAGYDRIALGVTAANPARRLYMRLGFETVRRVTAYHWWRV